MFQVHFRLPAGTAVRVRRGLGAALSAAAVLGAACACSSASPGSGAQAGPAAARSPAGVSPSPRGSASSGPIRITDAYLPQPAGPDVAAVYFTVADTGDQPDTLLSAASVPAAQVSLMSESAGGGAESMAVVAGGLSIPAHGQLAFTTGGYHVMLTDPAVPLKQGGTVQLTLTFRRAGKVTLDVPITSLLSDAVTGSDATSDATSMAGMPGM